MNNKAIIEFGFRRIWRILQISEGVIHLGLRPLWITPSLICRILHILRRGSRGSEMGEFSPPFSEPPSLFFFIFYPSTIEIIFDFSEIITKIHPPLKILDPPLILWKPNSIISKYQRGVIRFMEVNCFDWPGVFMNILIHFATMNM